MSAFLFVQFVFLKEVVFWEKKVNNSFLRWSKLSRVFDAVFYMVVIIMVKEV